MVWKSETYFLILSLGVVTTEVVNGACTAGDTDCVLVEPYYHKYQWATCVSNTYIKTLSKGKYHCRNQFTTYCYYMCMLESHDIDEGPVYDDCACDPNVTMTTHSSTAPALPDWCFSPDGTSCAWYTECLERRHPCSGTEYRYAVDYALKFCNMYTQNQEMFLPESQKWIDAVRKCLQVQLVNFLRPNEKTNCEAIQDYAFQSHSPCYLYPYPGEPSICDLDCVEWAKIFWTMKGAYVSATSESLKGMLHVRFGCLPSILMPGPCGRAVLRLGERTVMRLVQFVVNADADRVENHIKKRSISGPLDHDQIAGTIADQLAEQLAWKQDGVQWFAFAPNNSGNGSSTSAFEVHILLGARAELDLNSVNVPLADLNKTVGDLAQAIGNEQIQLDIGSNLKVAHFSACLDIDYEDIDHDVTPKLKKLQISGSSFVSVKPAFIAVSFITSFFIKP